MNLETDIIFEVDANISKKRIDAWPFSRKAHFYIKAKDMLTLNCKQYGGEKGKKETKENKTEQNDLTPAKTNKQTNKQTRIQGRTK